MLETCIRLGLSQGRSIFKCGFKGWAGLVASVLPSVISIQRGNDRVVRVLLSLVIMNILRANIN